MRTEAQEHSEEACLRAELTEDYRSDLKKTPANGIIILFVLGPYRSKDGTTPTFGRFWAFTKF